MPVEAMNHPVLAVPGMFAKVGPGAWRRWPAACVSDYWGESVKSTVTLLPAAMVTGRVPRLSLAGLKISMLQSDPGTGDGGKGTSLVK